MKNLQRTVARPFRVQPLRFLSTDVTCPYGGEYKLRQDFHVDAVTDTEELSDGMNVENLKDDIVGRRN